MQETIIVLYDNNELTVHANEVIKNGLLKLEEYGKKKRIILEKEINNKNFIRLKIKLASGKYQIQISGTTTKLQKRIIIK